jgi:hypothetical protein
MSALPPCLPILDLSKLLRCHLANLNQSKSIPNQPAPTPRLLIQSLGYLRSTTVPAQDAYEDGKGCGCVAAWLWLWWLWWLWLSLWLWLWLRLAASVAVAVAGVAVWLCGCGCDGLCGCGCVTAAVAVAVADRNVIGTRAVCHQA